MGEKRGCFKPALFGCLGLIVVVILIVGITALIAWNRVGDRQIEDRELTPLAVDSPVKQQTGTRNMILAGSGRVVLDLAQGDFRIHPAKPGEGLSVKARYDSEVYQLEDNFESLPDSSWVYRVRFYRTVSWLQALFQELLGGGSDTRVHVYLPPDIPIFLEIIVEEGGFEAELGGLWITAADISFKKGGFSLSVDEPLREPMAQLSIHGTMGGFEAMRLGNASPQVLDVECTMGGADIDLRGQWVQDSDIRLAVTMGGMDVRVPDGVEVQGLTAAGHGLRPENPEIQLPVLRFSVSESMGEIEIDRR